MLGEASLGGVVVAVAELVQAGIGFLPDYFESDLDDLNAGNAMR